MKKTKRKIKRDIFESEWFVVALLVLAGGIILLEIIAMAKEIDGTMFGLAVAGLGGIGGYLLKGFLKK